MGPLPSDSLLLCFALFRGVTISAAVIIAGAFVFLVFVFLTGVAMSAAVIIAGAFDVIVFVFLSDLFCCTVSAMVFVVLTGPAAVILGADVFLVSVFFSFFLSDFLSDFFPVIAFIIFLIIPIKSILFGIRGGNKTAPH